MGAHYEHRCARCGYSEDVSGGADIGMVSRTRTAVCRPCRRLVDVVVHLGEGFKERYPEEAAKMGTCPHCRGTDLELLPEEPDSIACPRCAAPLVKGALAAFWD